MSRKPSGPKKARDKATEPAAPPQLAAPVAPTDASAAQAKAPTTPTASPPAKLSDAAVAAFLKADLGFFERHPALVAELRVPHPSGAAVSLVEHQISILRSQLDEQRRRLSHIIARARDYEALSARLHSLTLALIAAPDWPTLEAVLDDAMCHDLNAQCVTLKLFDLSVAESQEDPLVTAFHDFLDRRHCLCGPLASEKSALLFGDFGPQVRSAALIPIHAGDQTGVLAIGSSDAARFHPDMATDVLDRMGEVVGQRLLAIAHGHA